MRVLMALWFCATGWAAPPLTTIEDTLFRADGTRFNGVAFIEWKSFQAANLTNIAAGGITAPIVSGVLRVKLVPTTNASSSAYYSVRYYADGRIQFDERWAVPPSSTVLKLKDVRISSPTSTDTGTAPPPLTQIAESDVVGLVEDLAARPVKGPGYSPSRVAFITEMGALEAVAGDLADCVRVDGTAGPCDLNTSTGPGFVDGETPSGSVDGSNATFTLAAAPSPAISLSLYRNGVLQKAGLDYTLAGNVITFAAGSIPQPEDVLVCSYRLADGVNPAGTGPQVLCSSTGGSTSSTTPIRLGSCTIPADMLQAGDRVEIRFSYSHEGTATGFTPEVKWGGTTLVSPSAAPGDAYVAGKVEAGIHGGGAQWDAQSWGTAMALATGAGNAADSLALPLVIDLLGRMAAVTEDTVTLRNFTVIRYPAKVNP